MEIQGFNNYYIYSDGTIYNMKSDIIKKPTLNTGGYYQVDLWNKGIHKKFLVHRLIALYYISNPENKPEVDHIDNDRTNNHIDNLRWVTKSENNQNRGMGKNNTSGIQNISYIQTRNRYVFQKNIDNKIHCKYFKTLEEAIKYKNDYLADLTSAPVEATA